MFKWSLQQCDNDADARVEDWEGPEIALGDVPLAIVSPEHADE